MVKIMKANKVVIILNGKFAGRKAVILKNNDEGTGDRSYGHAIVAGIDRYPRPVTAKMGKKRKARRNRIKPFVRSVNYTHLMPTRYLVDIPFEKEQLKSLSSKEVLKDPSKRKKARKQTWQMYVYKALKHVHPEMGISSKAMRVMNAFVDDLFDRVSQQAVETTTVKQRSTLVRADTAVVLSQGEQDVVKINAKAASEARKTLETATAQGIEIYQSATVQAFKYLRDTLNYTSDDMLRHFFLETVRELKPPSQLAVDVDSALLRF